MRVRIGHVPNLSDRMLGLVAGLASSAVVGGVSLLIYRQTNTLPATEISFARGIVGVTVTLPLIWRRLAFLVRGESAAIWVRAVAGAVSGICFCWNLQHTSVGLANILFDFSLILLLLIGHLAGEIRFSWTSVCALFVIFIGTWMYWYGVQPPMPSNVLTVGLLGAVAAALAYTAMKKATRTADPILIVWTVCAAAIPVSLIAGFNDWVVPTTFGWGILALIGLGMLLSQYLLTISFSRLPLPLASALIPSSIVWSVSAEALTSGAHATAHAIVGTLIYSAGICGLAADGNRRRVITKQAAA